MQLKFDSHSPPRTFGGPDEIRQYAEKQRDQWAQFRHECPGEVFRWFDEVVGAWFQLSTLFNLDPSTDSFAAQLQDRLNTVSKCIVFDSPFGDSIRRERQKPDDQQFSGALWQHVGQSKHQTVQDFNGAQLVGLVNGLLEAHIPRHLISGLISRASAEDEWNDMFKQVTREWDDLRNTFEEDLKLKTADELWSDRAETHECSYKKTRRWATGIGLGGFALVAVWLAYGLRWAASLFPDELSFQLAFFTALSVAGFTLLVWALRIIIRSMMTEHHLWVDASARSAMAHTYLALIKDKAASIDDRAIVLSSLFNPVTDGLIRDDAMPVLSPTGAVASAITGRSS